MATARKMIERLLKSGLTQEQIAKKTGMSQPSVSNVLNKGVDPSYTVGKKLEKLYETERTKR